MNGTVICVDENKDRGEAFVKGIIEITGDAKAHFYECDVRKPESLSNLIDTVTKDIGDISILVNCSTKNLVATYYNVSGAIVLRWLSDLSSYLVDLP